MRKQYSLFQHSGLKEVRQRTTYGGTSARGKRKVARPFATKKWLHIVLKAATHQHHLSLNAGSNRVRISKLLRQKARLCGVTLADAVIMRDHVHIKARSSARVCLQRFLRIITGCIARMLTGARRGNKFGRFWQGLAFTRVLKTAKEILYLTGYFQANRLEREQGYSIRNEYLQSYRERVLHLRPPRIHRAPETSEVPNIINYVGQIKIYLQNCVEVLKLYLTVYLAAYLEASGSIRKHPNNCRKCPK